MNQPPRQPKKHKTPTVRRLWNVPTVHEHSENFRQDLQDAQDAQDLNTGLQHPVYPVTANVPQN